MKLREVPDGELVCMAALAGGTSFVLRSAVVVDGVIVGATKGPDSHDRLPPGGRDAADCLPPPD